MATLAIEVLDTASGKMAEDVLVQARKIVDGEWKDLTTANTDSKGRAVLVESEDIRDGGYFEILVFLGAYFDQSGRALPQFKMVDIVPLRFGVEPAQNSITLRMSANPHSYSADFSRKIKRLNIV